MLVPYPLVSALLTMAERELFVPRWSEHILDEVERTLIGKLDLDPDKVKHRLDHMRAGFPESSVHGYKDLIEEMTCDGKDRHVLAAAVAAGADLLVTANIKDFPKSSYEQYGIEVIHPEVLLSKLFNHDEEGCIEALHADAGRRRNPPLTTEQLLAQLAGLAPTFANNVHQRILDGVTNVSDIPALVHGVGPAGAARILADTGDVARSPTRARFASWTGTAPLDASSGQQIRHRLSRAGNRRMNHVLHIAATVQLRNNTEGRTYFDRKVAAGKTSMEALRALKRRLSDVAYRQLVADAEPLEDPDVQAGPGGHCGAFDISSAADLPPHIGTSDQPLPGPAHPTLPPPNPGDHPLPVPAAATPRRRAGAVKVERPTGRTTLTATSGGAP